MITSTVARFSRNLSTTRALKESLSQPLKQSVSDGAHSGEAWKMWRNVFYICCCPAMIVAYINVQLMEEEPRPEFVNYPHLRIRRKPFPWRDGVKSLFHNPHTNALPTGYEH